MQSKCKYCRTPFKFYSAKMPFCRGSDECINACFAWVTEKKSKQIKAQTQRRKKQETKEAKESLKTLNQYENDAKKYFQKFVRLRDKGLPCISCGSNTKDVDGGHFKKAEIYSGLIFDERNCHSQCRKCNRFLGGNEGEYRIGLVVRYGEEYVKKIEEDSVILRNYKYTKQELIEIKNKYKQLIKDYERNR